jgi:hypothetical protein
MEKILTIALLFFGESLSIYAEVVAAKNIHAFGSTFLKMSLLMAIAGIALIAGYMLGVKYLQNIWVIGAISIVSIIIMEPIITYSIFHELPSKGALIGLVLGVFGLASALFIK